MRMSRHQNQEIRLWIRIEHSTHWKEVAADGWARLDDIDLVIRILSNGLRGCASVRLGSLVIACVKESQPPSDA